MAKKLNIHQEEFAYKKYVGSLYSIGDNLSLSQKVMNSLLLKKKKIKTSFFCYLNLIHKYAHKKNLKLPINFKYNLSTDFKVKLSRYKEFLQRNNYVFIDNFLEKESYDNLLKTWPKEFYFDPLGKIIKEYNWGFRQKKKITNFNFEKGDISYNHGLKKFYEFIISKNLESTLNDLLKFENSYYEIASILSTTARGGSFLIPHVDDVMLSERKKTYNCIYFVDGENKDLDSAGATSIYKDNNFQELIFQPTSLRNSMLIYNSTVSFYHGFKLTRKNMRERKTVNFQIYPNNYL